MLKGEDWQAFHTFVDKGSITPNAQKTITRVLDAIQVTIQDEEHYRYFRVEILPDFRQKTDEGICTLNYCIITLVNNLKFTHEQTKGALKAILLQYTVKYQEARD